MANIIIDTDYNKALKQAEELEDIAQKLSKLEDSDLANILSSIGKNWTGDCAECYAKKGAKARKHLKDTAKGVNKTAKTLREIVKREKAAEDAAKKLASIRSYSH